MAGTQHGDGRWSDAFATDGFALVPGVLDASECSAITERLAPAATPSGGTRGLLALAWCADFARRLGEHPALAALLPTGAVAVQCTYFEKSVGRNWAVPLQQDLAIPVAEKVDHQDLSGWSVKEGVWFVNAPRAILERLVAIRLHLEACTAKDGPLRVVPGSHRLGVFDPAADLPACGEAVACHAATGSALVLRPLLLHGSAKATGTGRRRLLHLLYGPPALTHGLRWPSAVAADGMD